MPKSPKHQFGEAFERVHERTMGVLRAYPDDQSDFKPHPRSRSAREVAWPLALGQERLMLRALTTGFDWSKPPPLPARIGEIAAAVERSHHKAAEALKTSEDAQLEGSVR